MADLHQLSDVHHGDAVGEVPDDVEIVSNEDIGQPQVVAQVTHQVEDARCSRDIQAGSRLISEEHVRCRPAPWQWRPDVPVTTQLVWIFVRLLGRQPDHREQVIHTGLLALRHLVYDVRLAKQQRDAEPWRQARDRVLENHLHAATQRTPLAPARDRSVPARRASRYRRSPGSGPSPCAPRWICRSRTPRRGRASRRASRRS